MANQTVVLGGGCFWCTEAIFEDLKGVETVVSGYAGGHVDNPTYDQVCNQNTGHAEVVQIKFDSDIISYKQILEIFFVTHDPTTKDQQGNDVGPQYRSVIFYLDDVQKETAEEVVKWVNKSEIYESPVVTEIVAFTNFFEAETYHQDYFKNNPNQGYCQAVINPKVSKFREKYKELLK